MGTVRCKNHPERRARDTVRELCASYYASWYRKRETDDPEHQTR